MKRRIAVFLLILGSTAFFAAAQTADSLVAAVPFPFYVGGKLLPAGTYRVQTSGDLAQIVDVIGEKGKAGAMSDVVTRISSSSEDKSSLVFDVVGTRHYLSEIYLPGEDGILIQGATGKHTHIRINSKG